MPLPAQCCRSVQAIVKMVNAIDQGSMALGTVHCTELAVLLPLRGRAWLSPTLQLQAFPSKPAKKSAAASGPDPEAAAFLRKEERKERVLVN